MSILEDREAAAIRARLAPGVFGATLHFVEAVPSTNDLARTLAAEGAAHGAIVVAGAQSAGRGRFGRPWSDLAGRGLAFTAILRPGPGAPADARATAVFSLAVREAFAAAGAPEGAVKWPNDVVLDGRKACGILTEAMFAGDAPPTLLVGVGVNVSGGRELLPDDLRDGATTLEMHTGRSHDRWEVLAKILDGAERRWFGSADALLREYRARSATLGRRVRVQDPASFVEGLAVDVREDLALRIRADDGSERVVLSGDVTHVREVAA